MDSQFFDAMTIANAIIIGSIFYAIHSSVRTRNQIENGRTNLGLALVPIGLTIIAMHYLANLVTIYFLPHIMSVSDTWTIMRSLRMNGSWVIMAAACYASFAAHNLFFAICVLLQSDFTR